MIIKKIIFYKRTLPKNFKVNRFNISTRFVYLLLLFISLVKSQSAQDINQIRSDYERLQRQSVQSSTSLPGIDDDQTADQNNQPRMATFDIYNEKLLDNDKNVLDKFFGYNFFNKRDSIPFWENLPAPSNYFLGPGDELIIYLWGETQIRASYIISRDGKIYDEKVGLMNLSGKTVNQAKIYLKEQFGRVYSTLNSRQPSTFIDVSLGQLRSINVNFVGQIKFPGIYPIHPFSTVITGLIQSGGIDTTGSLRNIQVKRDGKEVFKVDLYDYLIKGSNDQNLQLRDQDIVLVPPRISTITIDSAVVNPGIYEHIEGETVYDLINYAGGLKPNSSKNIGVKRISESKLKENKDSRLAFYVDIDEAKETKIINGDKISIRQLFFQNVEVSILGQVKAPGSYHYVDKMMLSELLYLSSGFEDSTFWQSVYKEKGEIIRVDPDNNYSEVISFNINDVKEGKLDLFLKNLDKVIIHANSNYYTRQNITINGEVKIPGSYPLIFFNETLQSIIDRAGGLTARAMDDGISIYRNSNIFIQDMPQFSFEVATDDLVSDFSEKIRVAWNDKNVKIMPGDSIVVKEKPGTVNVSGEIYNPGLVEFKENKNLRYYINAAGGLTPMANNKGIVVVYANGLVKPKKWYNSPKIKDGSIIMINQKPLEEPFDLTQFATNWTSIISSMIATIVLSRQI